MKKYLNFILLIITISASAQKGNHLVIRGDVSKLKDHIEEVVLFYSNNNHSKDSCLVKDGKYMFEVEIAKPSVGILTFRTQKGKDLSFEIAEKLRYRLYLQPGEMTVTSRDSVSNTTVTGSKWNADFQEYQQRQKKIAELLAAYQASMTKQKAAGDTVKAAKLEANFQKYYDSLRIKNAVDFALSHRNSPIALDALASGGGYPFNGEQIKPAFESLSPSIQNSEDGKRLKEKIGNSLRIGIGKMAPDFVQPDTAGVAVSLSSFRGKYVLVDFWANWCVFCRGESPHMIKAFEKYKDRGFAILSVSVDKKEDRDKWLKAIRDDGTGRWAQVADLKGNDNTAARLYAVSGYPTSYLVDPDGKIIAMNLRGEELINKLGELLDH